VATLAELPESDAAGELARIYDEIRVCCAVPYVSSLRAITALGDGCMGHSCGGLTTKIHALVHADGLPVRLELTAGQVHDSQPALDMIDCLGKGISCWRTREAGANIPPKKNRNGSFAFSKLIQYRGIATRYDKRPENFLAAVKIAAMRIGLRHYESTA